MKISNIKNSIVRRILIVLVIIPVAIMHFQAKDRAGSTSFDIRQAW